MLLLSRKQAYCQETSRFCTALQSTSVRNFQNCSSAVLHELSTGRMMSMHLQAQVDCSKHIILHIKLVDQRLTA
jgi:hypothetical protein